MRLVLAALLCFWIPLHANAGPISFDGSWKNQGFLFLGKNKYVQQGSRLDVISDDSVSILYKGLPKEKWSSTGASWSWSVSQSVPPTDLNQKKGEDRNLSLYFLFLDEAEAERLKGSSIRKLLGAKSARMLLYVWGGSAPPGGNADRVLEDGRGFRLVKRGAVTGSFSERVNLAEDYKRAFGTAPPVLFGLAVSADSDDTDTSVRASIEGLRLN